MKSLAFFISIVLVSGCSKKGFFEFEESESIVIDELPQDFKVPDPVWKVTLPVHELDRKKPLMYVPAVVKLREKSKGILKNEMMTVEFPRGGGEFDLDRITTGQPGTFHLAVKLPESKNALQTKIFFVSQSRLRKVDREVLGSGCKKLLDLSTAFNKAMTQEGLKLNTTRHRHASILSGHFVILAEMEKVWHMTQLTFFDSTRMDLTCEGFRSTTGDK